MHLFLRLTLGCLLGTAAFGQDLHDWQSASRLQTGDRVRLSLKSGHVDGVFEKWTPQDVQVGTVVTKREDVLRIERSVHGGSRGKRIGLGALIGFGGGFAIGAAAINCDHHSIGPCITRPEGGAVVGGVGAVIGALVGAILPVHSKELIYSRR